LTWTGVEDAERRKKDFIGASVLSGLGIRNYFASLIYSAASSGGVGLI
jgi:histone acetyltransferase (RNA polymerase elongator complex component)